jgi:hypothetical protein
MPDKSKLSDSGTYSRKSGHTSAGSTPPKSMKSSTTDGAEAKHENRFAEVTRKSREARNRLNAASQARAERSDAVERDREYARSTRETDGAETATVSGNAAPSTPRSAIEKAAAMLDGDAPDEEGA